jgi:hypothetical protein
MKVASQIGCWWWKSTVAPFRFRVRRRQVPQFQSLSVWHPGCNSLWRKEETENENEAHCRIVTGGEQLVRRPAYCHWGWSRSGSACRALCIRCAGACLCRSSACICGSRACLCGWSRTCARIFLGGGLLVWGWSPESVASGILGCASAGSLRWWLAPVSGPFRLRAGVLLNA